MPRNYFCACDFWKFQKLDANFHLRVCVQELTQTDKNTLKDNKIQLRLLSIIQELLEQANSCQFVSNSWSCKCSFTFNRHLHQYETKSKHNLHTAIGRTNQLSPSIRVLGARSFNYFKDLIDITIHVSTYKILLKSTIIDSGIEFLDVTAWRYIFLRSPIHTTYFWSFWLTFVCRITHLQVWGPD